MDALILVDIQNDFLPGGALEVKDGNAILPVVNKLIKRFDLVIATKDWHPADHKSFASNHINKNPGETIKLNGLDQILWPIHCVQCTHGAGFSEKLAVKGINEIFVKGTDPDIDSYSGFYDNGHLKSTGLRDYLRHMNVKRVFIVGLATDYCVKYTAIDAVKDGFDSYVIEDGTKAVNLHPDDNHKAIREMKGAGVKVVHSKDILRSDIL